jgi:hypothetical protein
MDPPREDGRRCKTVEELLRAGWRVNARGRWTPSPPDPRWAKQERTGP